jgi:hypothetical protein
MWPSDATVAVRGSACSASHPSRDPRYHTFISSVGDLLHSGAALHLDLPGARVNLAPTVLASIPSDISLSFLTSKYLKAARKFSKCKR